MSTRMSDRCLVEDFPLVGGRDLQLLAVLRDGAAREHQPLLLEDADDLRIAERLARVLVLDDLADPLLDGHHDTESPYELLMPLWKKYLSSNTPCGVCMYLLLTTRLTVDSCMPMSLATSRSTSGRRYSIPWSRNSRWKLMMLLATF